MDKPEIVVITDSSPERVDRHVVTYAYPGVPGGPSITYHTFDYDPTKGDTFFDGESVGPTMPDTIHMVQRGDNRDIRIRVRPGWLWREHFIRSTPVKRNNVTQVPPAVGSTN